MTARTLTTPIKAAAASRTATAHETTARESGPVESSFIASTNNSLRNSLLTAVRLPGVRESFFFCNTGSSRYTHPSMDKEMFDDRCEESGFFLALFFERPFRMMSPP
jgi:hypothetical protein